MRTSVRRQVLIPDQIAATSAVRGCRSALQRELPGQDDEMLDMPVDMPELQPAAVADSARA